LELSPLRRAAQRPVAGTLPGAALSGRGVNRDNVSMAWRYRRYLRRVIWGAVTLAAACVLTYLHLTSPTRLQACVVQALALLPVAGVEVGAVSFVPWRGLQISDLRVHSLGGTAPCVTRTAGLPPLLHVGSATVRCNPGELLLGRWEPREVDLQHVVLAVEYESGAGGADERAAQVNAGARLLEDTLRTLSGRLPRLSVAHGDVQLLAVDRGRPRLLQRWLISLVGEPVSGGYRLRVMPRPPTGGNLTELNWEARSGTLHAHMDWMNLTTLARFLPPSVGAALSSLELEGEIRVERVTLDLGIRDAPNNRSDVPGSRFRLPCSSAELFLRGARFTVPIEDAETTPQEPFVRVSDASVVVTYRQPNSVEPGKLSVTVNGKLRGAPVSLQMSTDPGLWQRLWPERGSAAAETVPPTFSWDDVLEADLEVTGLELPTAQTYPAFVRARRLSGPVAAVFEHYDPRGPVDIRLHLLPATADDGTVRRGAQRLVGEITPRGARCRYYEFPYEFADVRGNVRLAGGRVALEGISGRHGPTLAWAEGVINSTDSWTGFDLNFRARNVALDGDLYAALPEDYRQLWQRAAPLGLCDVVAQVRRADGDAGTGPLPTQVEVATHLLAGSLGLGEEQRLERADGWLIVRSGTVQVQNLHGYLGSAGVRLDGTVRLAGGTTHADLRVIASDLPLSRCLSAATPTEPLDLCLSGKADVWGRIWGADSDPARGQAFTVRIKDATLTGRDPGRAWSVDDGWAKLHDGRWEVTSLRAHQGAAVLELSGGWADSGAQQSLELGVYASTPAIQDLYPQFLSAEWTELIDRLALRGPGEIKANVQPLADTGGTGREAHLVLHAGLMRPQLLPLEFRDVEAQLNLTPGRFRLIEATARCGAAGQVVIRQAHVGTWTGDHLDADFDVRAERLNLDDQTRAALPGPLRDLLDKLAARGELDLLLPSVQVSGRQEQTWQFVGRALLREFGLRVGLDLHVAQGVLEGSCRWGAGGAVDLDLHLSVGRGTLAGRPVEHCEGELLHQAGERWVRLENVHGRLGDGVIQGYCAIDPQTADYELSLRLHDVAAAHFLPASRTHPRQPRPGRLDGEIWLRGRGDEIAQRRGGGNLRIRGVSFLQTPVLSSVARQRAPGQTSDHVDLALVRFLWEGRLIRLERVDIRTSDLRLVGEGTWDMPDDTVHLILWAAHPQHWPRVAVLSDLLESAGQELVQYRVDGPLDGPSVVAEPLYKLNDAIRRLLGEE